MCFWAVLHILRAECECYSSTNTLYAGVGLSAEPSDVLRSLFYYK